MSNSRFTRRKSHPIEGVFIHFGSKNESNMILIHGFVDTILQTTLSNAPS